jgi:hypothetical protein
VPFWIELVANAMGCSKKCLFSWIIRRSFAEESFEKMSRCGNGHLQRIIVGAQTM